MHRADEKYQMLKTYRTDKISKIAGEALVELSKDNTRALRIAEEAYRMGLPAIVTLQHEDIIKSAVFSSDGKHILTVQWKGTAKLWDLSGNIIADFNKHNKKVISAVFSPNGNSILTVF